MTTMTRQKASISLTSNRKRDISTNNFKYSIINNSNKLGRPFLPVLSIDNDRKNYFPLNTLSLIEHQNNINTRQPYDTKIENYNPSTIPLTSPHVSIPIPIPVSITDNVLIKNSNSSIYREERKLPSFMRYISKPIPITITRNHDSNKSNNTLTGERKTGVRTLVRIVPQRLKPGYNVRKNSTSFKVKPQLSSMHLKNWPNEALQNVQDLFNYEKYTSLNNEEQDSNNKITEDVVMITNREPLVKSPEIQPVKWSKIPVVEVGPVKNDRINIDTAMTIDNLLDNLESNKLNSQQHQTSSEIIQNTVVHILNAGSRKPNITFSKQENDDNKINRTKTTAGTRPPQNVHIMFMVNKDESDNNTELAKSPTEIIKNDSDCPTIMINSITQINNTIESKEGCTDLNIVINSHVLNNHILKPTQSASSFIFNGTETLKDPYADNNIGISNNYYQNDGLKNSVNQGQSNIESKPSISTFEVFQGTHINIGSGSTNIAGGPENFSGKPVPDQVIDTNTEELSFSDSGEEAANDIIGANPEEITDDYIPNLNLASEGIQSSVPASVVSDTGMAQANDAPGIISLSSLPNVPNLSNGLNQLTNLASNVASGGSGSGTGVSGQTELQPAVEDNDDDELIEALSPVSLLDSITSVFNYVSELNPINYGMFGMAVAPFVAFAVGIVGVAAFLFPWAFPGSLEVGRNWDNKGYGIIQKYHLPSLLDVVHSSIHKYRHLNEWKGRRRKKNKRR